MTEVQRLEILKYFWGTTWEQKQTYVLGTVLLINVKRKTTDEDTRKSETFNYNFRYKVDLLMQVYNIFNIKYLNTLCIKEWMTCNWVQKSLHGISQKKTI